MGKALYNDIDPAVCRWVEELIRDGLVAPGDVWCRDMRDIRPDEISEYTQFHAFCGVATWSYALRQAGWPDGRSVWTVSCPCQPFSQAGEGNGFADERHLWPSWFHIASQCKPCVIFGEQVASDDAKAWLDLVHDDMESLGYAFGAVVFPAAGVGAPHGRHRIWFVADADGERRDRGRNGIPLPGPGEGLQPPGCLQVSGMGDPGGPGLPGRPGECRDDGPQLPAPQRAGGPVNGFWSDAEWLPCSDGKLRPVKSRLQPLVNGTSRRVVRGGDPGVAVDADASPEARAMRIKGYGNGIVAPAAEEVIRAYLSRA